MTGPFIGIDFGTSNSAAAVVTNGRLQPIHLEAGHSTLPTAVFLDYAGRRTLYGRDAVEALVAGRDGRFMRALKSILGTPLARERRSFLNERLTLLEVVARFMSEMRSRASAQLGVEIRAAVAGRPVHFHSTSASRDAQAQADLAECYALAGFDDVRFLFEPEAAALAVGSAKGISLVVDIGGGTSDFTLFRAAGRASEVIASHGVRIGGTDFDRSLSLAHVMPLFGMGDELRNQIGPGRNAVPPALFLELASWEKIAFLYTPETLRDARQMLRQAVSPQRLSRLVSVLDMHLGHDVAFAVEVAKIGANGTGEGIVDLNVVEGGLRPVISGNDLLSGLWPMVERIGAAAAAVLAMAEIPETAVDRVVFVGGSSLITAVDRLMRSRFPNARFQYSDVFTAVVGGLAIAAAATQEDRPFFRGKMPDIAAP